MISVENLEKSFGAVRALQGVSFVAQDGRITGLLGANGAGKSTTLRIISTVIHADNGHAYIDGKSTETDSVTARRLLGVLPHASGLYPNLTARENIRYFGAMHGLDRKVIEQRTEDWTTQLEMQEIIDRRTKGFSHGQKLKVALARTLIHMPRNIILDEPTSGLDIAATRALRDLIRGLRDQGCCVLFSSHVMQEVAALCDDIVIIARGRVIASGTPEQVLAITGAADLRGGICPCHGNHNRRKSGSKMSVWRIIWTVFVKEATENLRDRRTMFSAFLFVPLMGPLLFSGMTAFMVDRVVGEADERLRLPVIGAEHAPNLMQFARENGADVVSFVGDMEQARTAVRQGREYFVLVVPNSVGDNLMAGKAAPIDVIWDSSNNKAQRHAGRARTLLNAYSSQVGALRLVTRGIDPRVMEVFDVRSVDIATPSGRALVLLGTLTYFLLFSLLMGGLYLAIDVTAGERERGSLESLLCLPVVRASLVLGKLGATVLFMLMALSITLTALLVSMHFLPLEKLGMSSNFGPLVGLKIAGILLPMSIFGAALLFVVGSFTRTYREAQTWLGAILAIPTLPILFASIANVRPSTLLMTIPSLSQHLIATNLLRGDAVEPIHVLVSVTSTLLAGSVLIWVATRLYEREKLLG